MEESYLPFVSPTPNLLLFLQFPVAAFVGVMAFIRSLHRLQELVDFVFDDSSTGNIRVKRTSICVL